MQSGLDGDLQEAWHFQGALDHGSSESDRDELDPQYYVDDLVN